MLPFSALHRFRQNGGENLVYFRSLDAVPDAIASNGQEFRLLPRPDQRLESGKHGA